MLCPPSVSANLNTGDAILFGVCLTALQGLRGPLGWKPAQATARVTAAAEDTVTGATSSHLPRDGADISAAAKTGAGASVRSRIFERGQVPKARGSRHHRHRGGIGRVRGRAPPTMERGVGCAPPLIFF